MRDELSDKQLDRAAGAVVCSAAGDALGAAYEFGPGLAEAAGRIAQLTHVEPDNVHAVVSDDGSPPDQAAYPGGRNGVPLLPRATSLLGDATTMRGPVGWSNCSGRMGTPAQ